MGRPSPRTQGVDEEGEPFQKFGTQQLDFVAPVVYGTPYQGVVQKDVGKTFKAGSQEWFKGFITSAPQPFGAPTVFSQRIIAGQTGATPVGASYVPPTAQPNGELDCPHCKHGCECENCKKGIGECSDKNPKCNAWDLGCEWFGLPNGNGNGNGEDCGWFGEKCWDDEKENGKDCGWFGEKCWFEPPDLGWVKWVLIAIGIGILLWLLRPLFGIAKNITET